MLLGFKKRFAEPILIGTKVFTIRKKRKQMPKIGETLYMYHSLRTTFSELITNKEKLIKIQPVYVFIRRHKHNKEFSYTLSVKVDGNRYLSDKDLSNFAKYDGFSGLKDFCEYWFKTSLEGKKNKDKITVIKSEMYIFHWTDLKL